MARPTTDNPRKNIVKTNLTDHELVVLEEASKGWSTLAGFIREAIIQKCASVLGGRG